MNGRSFDGAGEQPLHEVPLEREEDGDREGERDERRRRDDLDVRPELGELIEDRDRDRLRPNVSATIRSFQVHRNWKIASEATAGRPSGRISLRKIRSSEAPSIRADSRMSRGIPMKKFRSRKIANGSPNAVWKRMRLRTVSKIPRLL